MNPIIQPIDRKLIKKELTPSKYIRTTRKGGNELYEVTFADSPNIMREIGRLRELSFRANGGGTGKECDIDEYDTVGIIKYDAFQQMGGKLSFSLALLDENNNGFIINSVHSTEGCYSYTKEIKNGEKNQ